MSNTALCDSGDSVADSHDLCGDSPAGATVWLWGEWLGCAEGQFRDGDE